VHGSVLNTETGIQVSVELRKDNKLLAKVYIQRAAELFIRWSVPNRVSYTVPNFLLKTVPTGKDRLLKHRCV